MPKQNLYKLFFIFQVGNYIPALQFLFLLMTPLIFQNTSSIVLTIVFQIYFLPLIIYRIWHGFFGFPFGEFTIFDRELKIWWIGAQLQSMYLRFPFIEEILRTFPMIYTFWLRLWGAKIGSANYWSPQIVIMDRGYLNVGSFCILGAGARFSGHTLTRNQDEIKLILGPIKIENNVIIGGYTNIGPGGEVSQKEFLPFAMILTPFYRWEKGRKRSLRESHLK